MEEALKVDLNHADAEQLNALPHVGEATAAAIIEYREGRGCFRDIEELQNVKGFGGSKFEAISGHIRVDLTGCVFKNVDDGADPDERNPRGKKAGGGGLVNINTATEKELDALPGIGKTTAKKIIDYRNENGSFASIEDLMDVPGFKQGTFEKVSELVTVK